MPRPTQKGWRIGDVRGNNGKEAGKEFGVDYETCWMPLLVIFTFYHIDIVVSWSFFFLAELWDNSVCVFENSSGSLGNK